MFSHIKSPKVDTRNQSCNIQCIGDIESRYSIIIVLDCGAMVI